MRLPSNDTRSVRRARVAHPAANLHTGSRSLFHRPNRVASRSIRPPRGRSVRALRSALRRLRTRVPPRHRSIAKRWHLSRHQPVGERCNVRNVVPFKAPETFERFGIEWTRTAANESERLLREAFLTYETSCGMNGLASLLLLAI